MRGDKICSWEEVKSREDEGMRYQTSKPLLTPKPLPKAFL